MKLLYDFQAFFMQKYGGVSNSFVKLIENLPKDVDYDIALRECDNTHLINSNVKSSFDSIKLNPVNFLINKPFRGKGVLYSLYEYLFPMKTSYGRNKAISVEALISGNYDIFHPTFFDPYFLPYIGNKPYVLTVHDMIPELYYSPRNKQIFNKRKLALGASHLIAVSEKTKSDMIDIWGLQESKITVIYHGAPEKKQSSDEPIVDGKYILYVGQRHTYKSFIPMLKNLVPVLRRHKEIILICTGPDFSKEEISLFNKYGIIDRIAHICPDDRDLNNLYTNALCFIYPSQYEGFGIPILEAYSASCPVLLNNRSCFPEIARDAAVYFNLDNNQSDLESVLENFLIISDSDMKSLLERQKSRLNDFSWKRSAQKLSEVYNSLL